MREKSIITVKAVGIVAIATGLYIFLPGLRSVPRLAVSMCQGTLPPEFTFSACQLFFSVLILQALKIAAGAGLLFLKRWARLLAIPVLLVEFGIRLAGAINMWTWHLRHPEPPPIPSGDVVVHKISVWPSHLIGIAILICAIILLSKPIARVFNKQKDIDASGRDA